MVASITDVVMIPINKIVSFMNYSFELFGFTVSIGSWWAMCLGFGIVLSLLHSLSGTNILSKFMIKGVKGD